MKIPFSVSLLAASLITTIFADDSPTNVPRPTPSLAPLYAKLRPLVLRYYPQAKINLKDNRIHFEFNTRKYLIHGYDKRGGYTKEARQETGPQSPSRNPKLHRQGGIIGDIEIFHGPYGGAAAVPQVIHHHYFDRLIMGPYSKSIDHTLSVNLRFAKDMSFEFEAQFKTLMNQFGKHVVRTTKAPAKSN